MNRLHELAQRLGVETHRPFHFHTQIHDGQGDYAPLMVLRPDKDIAHDVLDKLPPRIANGLSFKWRFWYAGGASENDVAGVPFEEAVCVLAEKHLEQKP